MRALADTHGQPVSLIGWSLGGIYARELAKLHPDRDALRRHARHALHRPSEGDQRLAHLRAAQPEQGRRRRADGARSARPPPVPTTSIYSRSDGIVSWRCSLNEPARWPRTSRCLRATSAWASIRSRSTRSPIGWRSRPATGGRSTSHGARRWFFPAPAHPDAPAAAALTRTAAAAMQIAANGIRLEVEDHGSPQGEPLLLIMGLGMQLLGWHEDLVDLPRAARLSRHPLRQPRHRPEPELRSTSACRTSASTRCATRSACGVKSPYTLADMAADTRRHPRCARHRRGARLRRVDGRDDRPAHGGAMRRRA